MPVTRFGSLWIAEVSGDLSTTQQSKGIVLGTSLCSVELQPEVRFVSSDHPLFVEIVVVTCMKEKMEADRLKVQEHGSCFVPLAVRHICEDLDKYPSGMEALMSQPHLVQNHGKVSHFLQRDILEQPVRVEGPCPWQGGEVRWTSLSFSTQPIL